MGDDVDIWPQGMQLDMQPYSRCHIPITLDNFPRRIQGQYIAGSELIPCQLPGIAQDIAVRQAVGDVPGDMVVPALPVEYPTHRGLSGSQLAIEREIEKGKINGFVINLRTCAYCPNFRQLERGPFPCNLPLLQGSWRFR